MRKHTWSFPEKKKTIDKIACYVCIRFFSCRSAHWTDSRILFQMSQFWIFVWEIWLIWSKWMWIKYFMGTRSIERVFILRRIRRSNPLFSFTMCAFKLLNEELTEDRRPHVTILSSNNVVHYGSHWIVLHRLQCVHNGQSKRSIIRFEMQQKFKLGTLYLSCETHKQNVDQNIWTTTSASFYRLKLLKYMKLNLWISFTIYEFALDRNIFDQMRHIFDYWYFFVGTSCKRLQQVSIPVLLRSKAIKMCNK